MYRYERKENKIKKFFLMLLYTAVIVAITIYSYDFYLKINIETKGNNDNLGAVRLSAEQKKETDTNISIKEVTKGVVGISKIKDVGDSALMSSKIEELGLGSGIIISSNGYIVTNWHVAGNKYSVCYVTLENGKTYKGSTVWADSDLDVAIVKIEENGLEYLNLGDSSSVELGEMVYAIRKSNRFGISKNGYIWGY